MIALPWKTDQPLKFDIPQFQSFSATCISDVSNVFFGFVFVCFFFSVFFLCFCFFLFCFFWCFFCFFLCSFVFFYLPDVAVVPFWRGSVVSCAWQGFLSDVAVWCPVRGRFSFLTWQCGVLFMAVKKHAKKKHKKNRKRRKGKNNINKYIWNNLKWMWKNSSAAYVGYTAPIQNWGTSNFKGWSVFHGRVPC